MDDAHDLSLEHLMFIKEVTDQGRLQYDHPLGLCLVAAGRGNTIPLKETFDQPDPTWLQFRRRLDKLEPFCRIAGHTSEEVREILATLETVYQPLFPQLNLRQWSGSIYTWLTHPVLDPTHSGRVTMDNLMKLVTTALEWTYEAGETDVQAERLKNAAELLVLRRDTLRIIDGTGPTRRVPKIGTQNQSNVRMGKSQQRETVQANEQQNTTETVETAKNRCKRAHHPNARLLEWFPSISQRFAESCVALVECPDCGRTRSLSPSKGVLRFPSHDKRKIRTLNTDRRWIMRETAWEVAGGEEK